MEINGTTYNNNTALDLAELLERARFTRSRVRVFYGDTATGRDWREEYDTTGYIGRSTGTAKIPLIVHNERAMGGPALLDNCIVKVMSTSSHRVLYEHPAYNLPAFTIEHTPAAPDSLPWEVSADGQLTARFATADAARRYVDFMTGARMNK
jgi:hypothetical protein